jgi:hypothetical protein
MKHSMRRLLDVFEAVHDGRIKHQGASASHLLEQHLGHHQGFSATAEWLPCLQQADSFPGCTAR